MRDKIPIEQVWIEHFNNMFNKTVFIKLVSICVFPCLNYDHELDGEIVLEEIPGKNWLEIKSG